MLRFLTDVNVYVNSVRVLLEQMDHKGPRATRSVWLASQTYYLTSVEISVCACLCLHVCVWLYIFLVKGPAGEIGPPGQQGNPGAEVLDQQNIIVNSCQIKKAWAPGCKHTTAISLFSAFMIQLNNFPLSRALTTFMQISMHFRKWTWGHSHIIDHNIHRIVILSMPQTCD